MELAGYSKFNAGDFEESVCSSNGRYSACSSNIVHIVQFVKVSFKKTDSFTFSLHLIKALYIILSTA